MSSIMAHDAHVPRRSSRAHEPGVLEHAPHESPWVVTRAADPAGDSFGAGRLVHRRADAVRRLVRIVDPCRRRERRAGRTRPRIPRRAADGAARVRRSCRSGSRWPVSRSPRTSICSTRPWHGKIKIGVEAGVDRCSIASTGSTTLYFAVFARGGVKLGRAVLEGAATARDRRRHGRWFGSVHSRASRRSMRRLQSGYLYHYAFAMILGLILLLGGFWLIGPGWPGIKGSNARMFNHLLSLLIWLADRSARCRCCLPATRARISRAGCRCWSRCSTFAISLCLLVQFRSRRRRDAATAKCIAGCLGDPFRLPPGGGRHLGRADHADHVRRHPGDRRRVGGDPGQACTSTWPRCWCCKA